MFAVGSVLLMLLLVLLHDASQRMNSILGRGEPKFSLCVTSTLFATTRALIAPAGAPSWPEKSTRKLQKTTEAAFEACIVMPIQTASCTGDSTESAGSCVSLGLRFSMRIDDWGLGRGRMARQGTCR
jgi:hypothetical protein